MFSRRCYEVGQIIGGNFMMIVLPSLIIVVIMLIPAYIINFNQKRSKRDKRVTVYETNLYKRDAEVLKSEPIERNEPVYENKMRSREPVKSFQRRRRENFKTTSEDPERFDG